MPEQPVSVLFVCLGNICRSTMAEGIFRHIAQKPPYKGLIAKVDSCGTGTVCRAAAYHVGDPPDERTMETLEDHGIFDYVHAGRKVSPADFDKFDYIFAMDRSNLQDLQRLQQRGNIDSKAKVMLFGEFSGGRRPEVVEDPYYGGGEGFSKAYEQCSRFSANFLKHVFPNIDPKA
ncbi:Low molecular weight phosphotyrosine protein phosphatase [Colletotrichum plurivorum]|uniref:Low molecular weight phosphotyrosine protein phosphatase n=1 Tax=Colletotrichum plurivorum TaxID=2175906 RepID=A0A8H6K8V1_9PEZI|nr:Low molecular weight phosphotyrosine protein phosphatase [Colletotrichum plurivorum]